MRILYLSDILNIHDLKFLEKFISSGHEIILYTFYNRQKNIPKEVEALPIDKIRNVYSSFPDGSATGVPIVRRIQYYLDEKRAIKQLLFDIKKTKPDVIFSQWAITSGYIAAKTDFHPIVLRVWGSDVLVLPKLRAFYRKRTVAALKASDLVIFNSNHVLNEAVKLAGDIKKRAVLQCQLDRKLFNPKRKRQEIDFGSSVISTRPLRKIYGVDTLIQAASLLSNIKIVIAGDGEEEEKLKQQSKGVKNIIFVGRVPNEKLALYINGSMLYVSTSYSDGTSLSLLEAMSCGLPVVVSDISSNREWVTEGVNGFLFKPGSSEELARKIELALSDVNKLREMGSKNLEIINERADSERDFSRLIQLVSEIAR